MVFRCIDAWKRISLDDRPSDVFLRARLFLSMFSPTEDLLWCNSKSLRASCRYSSIDLRPCFSFSRRSRISMFLSGSSRTLNLSLQSGLQRCVRSSDVHRQRVEPLLRVVLQVFGQLPELYIMDILFCHIWQVELAVHLDLPDKGFDGAIANATEGLDSNED